MALGGILQKSTIKDFFLKSTLNCLKYLKKCTQKGIRKVHKIVNFDYKRLKKKLKKILRPRQDSNLQSPDS